MDVEITGRNRRNGKETFLFNWLDCWPIFYKWGRGEGYLVDIMALGVGAYLYLYFRRRVLITFSFKRTREWSSCSLFLICICIFEEGCLLRFPLKELESGRLFVGGRLFKEIRYQRLVLSYVRSSSRLFSKGKKKPLRSRPIILSALTIFQV